MTTENDRQLICLHIFALSRLVLMILTREFFGLKNTLATGGHTGSVDPNLTGAFDLQCDVSC